MRNDLDWIYWGGMAHSLWHHSLGWDPKRGACTEYKHSSPFASWSKMYYDQLYPWTLDSMTSLPRCTGLCNCAPKWRVSPLARHFTTASGQYLILSISMLIKNSFREESPGLTQNREKRDQIFKQPVLQSLSTNWMSYISTQFWH